MQGLPMEVAVGSIWRNEDGSHCMPKGRIKSAVRS